MKEREGDAQIISYAADMYYHIKKLLLHRHQGTLDPIDFNRLEVLIRDIEKGEIND